MSIKRLFWKIFAAFWLANLAIMAATFWVVIQRVEAERSRLVYQRAVNDFAEHLIAGYEAYPSESGNRTAFLQHLARNIPGDPRARQVLAIYHGDQLIFSRDRLRERNPDTVTFHITSTGGQHYRVEALAPRPPRLLYEALRRMLSIQLVFILLASTLVSVLLSWSITRPLKKLGQTSRQFAQSGESVSLPAELLTRADEIGDLAQDFAFMMRQTRQTLNAQQQLLHHVSHELRAPLARLQVAAELIQQQADSESPWVDRIHAECERMNQLIQRILNYSRLDSPAELTAVDVAQLIAEQAELIRFEYPQRPVITPQNLSNVWVQGNAELLAEAIDNILRNACKYTSPQSPIHIELEQSAQQTRLVIRDFGPGVAPEDLSRLSAPFYRAANGMHGEGFGLGLSIAQRALAQHHGQLQIQNHPEGGLAVSLILPGGTRA